MALKCKADWLHYGSVLRLELGMYLVGANFKKWEWESNGYL